VLLGRIVLQVQKKTSRLFLAHQMGLLSLLLMSQGNCLFQQTRESTGLIVLQVETLSVQLSTLMDPLFLLPVGLHLDIHHTTMVPRGQQE